MSTPIYDIIIVGGGIAGLYTAYCAIKRDPNRKILILEKDNRLGGRMYTYQEKDFPGPIEYGAGRFHKGHTLLVRLIDDLGMKSKMNPIIPTLELPIMKQLMEQIIQKYHQRKNDQDIELSFQEYVVKKLFVTSEEMKFIESQYGYSAELSLMNMKDAMVLIEDMRSHTYYGLGGGFSQIIDKLEDILNKKKCHILKTTPVKIVKQTTWDKDQTGFLVQTENGEKFMSKKCVLAVPKEALTKFSILRPIKDKLNSITTTPLCRIYAQYEPDKDGDYWFQGMGKVTVPNTLRYVIPYNQEKGVIMISYTDDKYAKWWHRIWKHEGVSSVKSHLHSLVKATFPWANAKTPRKLKIAYWDAGVAFWKTGIKNSKSLAKEIARPLGNHIELYICGENYSPMQQWIESALITCPLKI